MRVPKIRLESENGIVIAKNPSGDTIPFIEQIVIDPITATNNGRIIAHVTFFYEVEIG